MADPPRNWDKELAEIDRLLAKGGPVARAPAPAGSARPPAPSQGPPQAPLPAGRRGSVLGTWLRALSGIVVAAAMTQWPYAHACGIPLLLYTGAAAAVVVAGGWGAVASWRSRIPAAHIVSLVAAGWGLGLLASVILPRIGYAAAQLSWWCR
jgi:hypothetical protein